MADSPYWQDPMIYNPSNVVHICGYKMPIKCNGWRTFFFNYSHDWDKVTCKCCLKSRLDNE